MASIISAKNFTIKSGGYGITTSPVDAANYFYISETNNGHGKDLDSLAATMMSTEGTAQDHERAGEAPPDEVATYVPPNARTSLCAVSGLANPRPHALRPALLQPERGSNVGW